jgi:hypothetical protein
VRLHPDRQLVREVADRFLGAISKQEAWIVPNIQTIAELPDEVV